MRFYKSWDFQLYCFATAAAEKNLKIINRCKIYVLSPYRCICICVYVSLCTQCVSVCQRERECFFLFLQVSSLYAFVGINFIQYCTMYFNLWCVRAFIAISTPIFYPFFSFHDILNICYHRYWASLFFRWCYLASTLFPYIKTRRKIERRRKKKRNKKWLSMRSRFEW